MLDSKTKILHIQNYNRLDGTEYWNGRYVCTWSVETEQQYRFQFRDTQSPSGRYLWIEINRIGRWDTEEGRWMYSLNYQNVGGGHFVSADYFSDMDNVIWTMGECLKRAGK